MFRDERKHEEYLETKNREWQQWLYEEEVRRESDKKDFAKRAAKAMEDCEATMQRQRDIVDGWKRIPLNQVLIPEEMSNIFGMINNGFTFMQVSDYTKTVIQSAREGELFRHNEIMREQSERSSKHMQELGDYQPPHQSSAPHAGSDELPPMPLSLYERFKKERDSLDIDKESGTAVRKLSKGAA